MLCCASIRHVQLQTTTSLTWTHTRLAGVVHHCPLVAAVVSVLVEHAYGVAPPPRLARVYRHTGHFSEWFSSFSERCIHSRQNVCRQGRLRGSWNNSRQIPHFRSTTWLCMFIAVVGVVVSWCTKCLFVCTYAQLGSARAAGSSSVSIAVDKETTLTELKSLVADHDLVKTNLSVMVDLAARQNSDGISSVEREGKCWSCR